VEDIYTTLRETSDSCRAVNSSDVKEVAVDSGGATKEIYTEFNTEERVGQY